MSFLLYPAFALLFGELWQRSGGVLNGNRWLLPLASICGFGALIVTAVFVFQPN